MRYTSIIYSVGAFMLTPVLLLQTPVLTTISQPPATVLYTAAKPVTAMATNKLVDLAVVFKATLTKDQAALLQRGYSKSDAVRWSNFPQAFSNPNRVGLSLATLNAAQLAAFKTLMEAALVPNIKNEGYDELEGVRVADDELGKATGKADTFGAGNYFIAFLGEPSTTGLWELQYGGHHFAFSNTYNKGAITGATPSFRGVEPMKPLNANGRTYQPLEQEKEAFADFIKGLSEADRAAAKLSSTFTDVILGPGQDGNFPLKKVGIKASALSAAQQKQVLQAIALYVNDLDPETAKTILKKYTAELPETYIAYTGTGSMEQVADYIRIDGPGVWIEYAVQPSRDFANITHPHSIWRDHKSDYGGN